MTQTQIGYWNYKETQRHDLATERLQAIDVDTRRGTLNESIRHNKITESQNERNLVLQQIGLGIEQQKADASTKQAKTAAKAQRETVRHDKVMETMSAWQNKIRDREVQIKEWATSLEARKVDIQATLANENIKLMESQIGVNNANAILTNKKSAYYVGELVLKAKEPWQLIGLVPSLSNDPKFMEQISRIYEAGSSTWQKSSSKSTIEKLGKSILNGAKEWYDLTTNPSTYNIVHSGSVGKTHGGSTRSVDQGNKKGTPINNKTQETNRRRVNSTKGRKF